MRRGIRNLFEKLSYRHEQWSLQKRLILTYVLIMLIPSILVSLTIFNEFSGIYIKDVEKKNENTLEIERININNNIETMERTSQLSIADADVKEYLVRRTELETSELIAFSLKAVSNITRLQYNNPNIVHIRLFADNKHMNELYPVIWRENRIKNEPWYNPVNALNGMELWSFSQHDRSLFNNSTTDASENLPKLALLKEIEYPLGKHAGILEVDMQLSSFFPKTYGSTGDDQSQIVIADNQGDLYYNEKQSLLAKAGVSKEMLRSVLAVTTRKPMESFRFTLGNKPFLGIYSYIEPLDAHMVNVVSLEGVLRDMQRTRNKIILANVILIAILSVATYFLNALILKRLHILADSMKKVRQGDFHLDIPVRGGGEVGELAHHFRKMLKKINELIADAVNKKAASKETELKSLKNQIDSHFLYNTLENIKMLAEIEGQFVISDALTSLGGLMRYNLKWTSEYVRLQDEVSHITNYIGIMNVRFEHKVNLLVDIPDALMEQELLKMSLQPVVENAVKHGLRAPSGSGMSITIEAAAEDGTMIIAIADDGIGMPQAKTEELNQKIRLEDSERQGAAHIAWTTGQEGVEGSGIGLRNVHKRIQLYYGKEYGIRVESAEGAFTRVIMRIPYFILTGGAS